MQANTSNKTVVYLICNDWLPSPSEAERLIFEYLDCDWNTDDIKKQVEMSEKWISENDICVNQDVYDMSTNYWITTTKEWLEKNFPELLPYAHEIPEYRLYHGEEKYFLRYIPENIGKSFFINEHISEDKFDKEKWRLINNG